MPIFEVVHGWALTIYLNDHLPIHFHAKKAGMSVRFYLDGTFEVEGHGRLSGTDRKRLSEYALGNQQKIKEYWDALH